MIYLLVLILLLQGAQLFLILKPKKSIKEMIITSKEGTKIISKDSSIKEVRRVVLCPVCNKEITGKMIRRRDGLYGCDQCSSSMAS